MSTGMSAGQGILAVVGAAVGGVFFGPAGAAYGFQMGSMIGGLLDPPKGPTISGPRLNDLAVQTSTYGQGIPRIYGTVAISGNVIWLEKNQLKEVVKKKKSGGKGGGGGTTTKTYSYFATFALALCEGEIAGIRRIWCSDKLIYNAGSDDLETIIASNQAAKGWRLYRGTDDQLPDSRMEADIGVGRTPAYRGLAYLVFDDFALADYSNTLQAAQFKVEVVTVPDEIQPDLKRVSPASNFGTITFTSDGNVIRTYEWDTSTAFKLVEHYPSSTMPLGSIIRPVGYRTAANAFRVIGARDFFIADGRDGFAFDGKAVSTSAFGPTWTDFDVIVGSDRLFVKARSFTSERKAVIVQFDGVSIEIAISAVLSICLGPGVLYVLTNAAIHAVDLVDGSILSSTSISTPFTLSGNSTFCYFYEGLVWVTNFLSDPATYELLAFDPSSGTLIHRIQMPGMSALSGSGVPFIIGNGVLYAVFLAGNSGIAYTTMPAIGSSTATLESIMISEIELSSLIRSSDLDASLLGQQVNGYRIPGGAIRSSIEPLQGAYPFDVVQSGYQLKCVARGQASAVTIPWEDLAANDGGEIGDMLAMPREMDTQLPQRVGITALSSNREYASSTQYAERLNTRAVNVEQREIPLVLSDDEIAQMADTLLYLRWLERTDAELSLSPTYLGLEPADVVTATTPYGVFELRITEINYETDGRLTCKAKPNNAAIYSSTAVGAPTVPPAGTVPLMGPSIGLLLDIPVIDETIQNAPGFVSVMTSPANNWPGGVLVRSNDDGQTWVDLQGYNARGSLGVAINKLNASSCIVIDQRSLQVSMISGEPDGVTRDQMLAGANYVAYGVDGRWEIMRYQNAALQADGTYLLSGFVRGEKGTEWSSGLHAAGDYLVVLDDPDHAFIGSPVESIGLPRLYRGVTSGASVDSASDIPFTYHGVNLECLSPVYARGSRDGAGNFSGSFTRRSRLSSSWWVNGVQAPVGETSEAYEVDVMSGASVKRTISVSSPAFAYTAADQVTDFGSAQSTITFRIYQLSEVVGRGYPLEVTL